MMVAIATLEETEALASNTAANQMAERGRAGSEGRE